LEHTRHTIEWAERLGAEVVVLHLGEASGERRWENALRARWLQGDRDSVHFANLASQIASARAAQTTRSLDAVRHSLDELVPFAEAHGVALGIENGEWAMAFPTPEEAAQLLDEFDSCHLGLWVDTGHATILERLGFSTLMAWLHVAPARLLGLHYHDVSGLRDHLIPGKGTIAWENLAPHVPRHALPTCEFDWYYTVEEIAMGARHLAQHDLIEWEARARQALAGGK
jgi:sugar phosphate isomerase/epimerase